MRSSTTVPAPVRSMSRQSGFSLFESLLAITLMTLIMMGVMNLFLGSLRLQSRTMAEIDSTQSAARAVYHVSDVTRDALYFSLPSIGTDLDNQKFSASGVGLPLVSASVNAAIPATLNWSRFGGYNDNSFVSSSGTGNCKSGIFIMFPASAGNADVVDVNGNTPSPALPLYDRTGSPNSFLVVFRANSSGVPAPTNGGYLWETGYDNGVAVDKYICSNIDPYAWDAVQFVRPTDTSNNYINDEVEIKVTCGEYSAINGKQTSEAINGTNTTQLVGKCVSLRNYDTTGTYDAHTAAPTAPSGGRFRTS